MITRRIVVNLIAFAVLSGALIAYGFFDLLGNPLSKPTTVSTVLPSASGLAPNFDVALDGVDVGLVKSVSLVPNGAKVTMTLNPGTHVPSDVQALVTVANPLGEQEIQLVPRSGSGSGTGSSGSRSGAASLEVSSNLKAVGSHAKTAEPSAPRMETIRNGAVIPAAPDSTPAQVGTVVAEATKLLQSIPAGSFNELLHEAAVALNGNVGSLRTIASASELFSQEFLAQQQQFEALLSNAPPVLDTVTQNASSLQQGLADTAVLVEVLAKHSNDLSRLFDSGSQAAASLQTLVTENEPNLACIVHDSADINANFGSGDNLRNLSTVLSTNQLFFGAIAKLAVTGPAIAMNKSDSARTDQEWLRTRLLIPDLQTSSKTPQPVQYSSPTTLPAVLPGAGCDTEFGQGAAPVSQPGFRPAGPNAKVIPATAAQAQVRGGGTEPTSAAPATARLRSGIGSELPAAVVGMFVLGWLITLGHRRSSRSARPLRIAVRNTRRRSR